MADVRNLLTSMGVPNYLATMAIPFMWYRPGTVDPDSASVIEIIKGLQRGLHSLGYPVTVTGVLDPPTAKALDNLLLKPKGAWMEMPWIDIYTEVAKAKRNPTKRAFEIKHAKSSSKSVGEYFEYDGPPVGPFPGKMIGTPPGPLGAIDMAESSWCSPANPQGNCVPTSSIACGGGAIAKPMDKGTLNLYKSLQTTLNRLLAHKGLKTIAIDGRIGPCMVKAINDTTDIHKTHVGGADAVASQALRLQTIFLKEAARVGAPPASSVKPATPSAPPSVANPDGSIKHPPNWKLKTAGFGSFIKSPLGLAVLAISGYALYNISQKPKGKKKSKGLLEGWF